MLHLTELNLQGSALSSPDGDGPFLFSSMLTSNFRVETFNITAVGTVKSFFAQGGVRYQQATLISGESVTFASIKIHPLSSSKVVRHSFGPHRLHLTHHWQLLNAQKKAIPGSFKCSNKLYNRIWDLGVHVIDQSCVENGTQLSTWELAGEDGVLVRGQRAARSSVLAGQLPSSYNLTFETNIHRAGTGWAVDTTAGGGAGIWSESVSRCEPHSGALTWRLAQCSSPAISQARPPSSITITPYFQRTL